MMRFFAVVSFCGLLACSSEPSANGESTAAGAGSMNTSGSGGTTVGGAGSGGVGGAAAGATSTSASGLPVPSGAADRLQPAGAPANLAVLPWAGFVAAMTVSIDDSAPSSVLHEPEIAAAGAPVTWYVSTAQSYAPGFVAAFQHALAEGHELGNHTVHHCNFDTVCNNATSFSVESEVDAATTYIEGTLGAQAVHTMAYPFGDVAYGPSAEERFFLARGVISGTVLANDSSDPFNLPAFGPSSDGQLLSSFTPAVDSARAEGSWLIWVFHGLMPGAETWEYAKTDVSAVTGVIAHAQSTSDVWIDTLSSVGAYWLGQKLVTAATPTMVDFQTTWTWTLPAHFPAGKYLRVSVDGGTLSQNGVPLVWDAHGYYEVALDAGTLLLSP
jgi:peptidoglycan/xylan/chitin deacetylase (PgdA/CDA1 family)